MYFIISIIASFDSPSVDSLQCTHNDMYTELFTLSSYCCRDKSEV